MLLFFFILFVSLNHTVDSFLINSVSKIRIKAIKTSHVIPKSYAWSDKFDGMFKSASSKVKYDDTSIRYLESNSWGLKLGDINIFIDPIMSQLDFGIPLLYRGNKKVLDNEKELKNIIDTADVIFISQGFDDHAHVPTLTKLAKANKNLPYICPPSAKSILLNCGIEESQITIISPGQKYILKIKNTELELIATTGALLGPPWQQKENGYIIRPTIISKKVFKSIYYEPHCMNDPEELANYEVDIVITPIVSQELPAFTLVAGGAKAYELAKLLKAKYIIPMANGELMQKGLLSRIIKAKGSEEEFMNFIKSKTFLSKEKQPMQVIPAPPGLNISL